MYLLKTSNRCNIFDTYSLLNEIKVTIKTDLEVISSNADVVNNNLYTWLINRNNYNNKSIKIHKNLQKEYDKNIFDNQSPNPKDYSPTQ